MNILIGNVIAATRVANMPDVIVNRRLANVYPPVAEFSGTPLTPAADGNVQFTDLSTGTPTSWLWRRKLTFDVSYTTFSTSQHPLAAFPIGPWDVRLTVSNAASSDSETKLSYITAS